MVKFSDSWSDMTNGSRASLLLGVIGILAMTVGAFYWLARDNYQVLFTDLEPRDAASVVSELERMKIKYKVEGAEGQIKVPEPLVHEVRLKLMGTGVPLIGGVGFEIFNDSGFGMTEFAQRINYQRALEGELTRTVMSLKEVKYARVHLVMPERGIFQQDGNQPSASVTLFLEEGSRPSMEQVLGIQRLVSAAVPRLKAWQVMVTDQSGLTLSRQIPENDGVAAISGRLEQKQAVEKYLTEKVDKVLKRNFGDGQAMVGIDAELDFNQAKRTRENVLPSESQVLRRRETRQSSGNSSRDGGENVTTEIEYRLGRDVEQIVETPGGIVRLSIGVMIPAETSEAQRQEIRDLVMMTVGFDNSRGDAIVVYALGEHGRGLPVPVSAPPAEGFFQDEAEPWLPEALKSERNGPAGRQPWRANGSGLGKIVVQHPIEAGAFSFAVIITIWLVSYRALRRKSNQALTSITLSETDRARILKDIRTWLDPSND